jgi:hypothetical protein
VTPRGTSRNDAVIDTRRLESYIGVLCGQVLVIVNWDRFEILRLEDLVTIETPDIIDPVTPGQYLSARVLT